MNDVVEISRGTTKEDELFDYVKAPSYMKNRKSFEKVKDKAKDDYELSL